MNKLRDRINFLSGLTFKRGINATKVIASYYYARLTRKPVQWGVPISLSIEPTTACNLGCPECPSGLKQFTRNTGNLKEDFFREVLHQMGDRLAYLNFYFQGEPYINPNFLSMVTLASTKGIYTSTSTNAHFLTEEVAKKTVQSGLDRLIISIDGTTQATYESYRINGQLEKVLEGTKNIVKWKKELQSKTPHVVFQFLVVKPNEHQVEEVRALGKEMGVDEVRFKTAQLYDFKHGNDLMPSNNKYSRYEQTPDGTYRIKNKLSNNCWKLWHSCVITWDGLVVPCCFDKDAQHQMGDLKQTDFNTLWHGKAYQQFRTAMLRSRRDIDICKNCTEGTKVWT